MNDPLLAALAAYIRSLGDAQLVSIIRGWFTPIGGPVGPDLIPPTDPAGLSASSVAAPVLMLMTLSTDNIAVTGYEVWRRAGGASAKIATTQSFPYTDSSAGPSITYNYKVRAFDAAGNFSNFCAEAAATTPGGLAPDTTAPLTPSAPTLITNGSTSIVLALPLTTDSTVNSGTQVVSGMKDGQVYVGGVATGAPVPQPSQAISFAGAGQLIGSPAIAGSSSLVSGTYTVACGGNQFGGGAADQGRVIAANVIGDFDISFRFVSNSGGQQFSRQFLCVRAGFDPAAQMVDIECLQDATQGFNSQFRAQSGQNCGWNGALYPHALPYFGRIRRQGNVFDTWIGSDGSTWPTHVLNGQTIAMPSVVQLCVGCSADDTGTPPTLTFTSIFDTLSFTGQTVAQFTDTFQGSASPVPRVYTQTWRDNALNVSAASASLTVTPTALSGAIKWHPGHYVNSIGRPSIPSNASLYQSQMNDMSAAKSGAGVFKGYQGEYTWYYLESAAGGQYFFDPQSPNYNPNNVIAADLAYLARLSAQDGVDYKLIIYLESESFSGVQSTPQPVPYSAGAGSSSTSIAPDYFINGLTSGAGSGTLNNNFGVATLCLWRQNEMTAFINLVNALGRVFDANPHVEMIIPLSETGMAIGSITTSDPTYSSAALLTQWERLAAAMATSWPSTNKVLFNNFTPQGGMAPSDLVAVTQNFVSKGFGMGGPDILYPPQQGITYGDQILRGINGFGTTDYRGSIPVCYEDQANWSNWTNQTQAGAEAYAFNTLKCTHVVWEDIPSGQTGGQFPNTEWPATVAALKAVNFRIGSSACPGNYSACNTS